MSSSIVDSGGILLPKASKGGYFKKSKLLFFDAFGVWSATAIFSLFSRSD
jgi:hypothetical protein